MSSSIPAWWSILLAAIGVAGLYLTTRGEPLRWYGYLVGLAAQVLWIAYAIHTGQPGFVMSALAYGFVNAIGIGKWVSRRRERETGPFAPYQ